MAGRSLPSLDTARRHATLAVLFHWTIAGLFAALLGLGWTMTRVQPGSELQFELYQLHKSLGVTVLLLSLLRLARLVVAPPLPLPRRMPRRQQAMARAVQGALLALTVAIPLAGWALVSASRLGIPTMLFGIVPWPDLPGIAALEPSARSRLEPALARAHAALAYAAAGLAVLHAGAAMFHHVVRGDDALWRMLPLPFLRRR